MKHRSIGKIGEGKSYESMDGVIEAVEAAVRQQADSLQYLNWRLERVYGGMNGMVYRLHDERSPGSMMVAKLRKRDPRHRALREFSALHALKDLPDRVAPDPVALYTDLPGLPGDVVVSSWVDGEVLNDLSEAPRALWEDILVSFVRCHSLCPSGSSPILDAVIPVRSTPDLAAEIDRRYALLPDMRFGEVTRADIGFLWQEFRSAGLRTAQAVERIGLITCDMNPTNMISRPGGIVFVDWENSGWGDPAFDMADLLVRPNCMTLSQEMRSWVMSRYGEMMDYPQAVERITAYERLMLIFWLILSTRAFAPQTDARYAGTNTMTQEQSARQQIAYLNRIEEIRALL